MPADTATGARTDAEPRFDVRLPGDPAERPVVLVIDDDQGTRDLVGAMLERQGLAVVTAADGGAGLSAAAAHTVAAVVLDVVMPEVDGHEVLRQLRAGLIDPTVPVIVLTGLDTLDCELESVLSGADSHLTKPVRSADLVTRLRGLI
jgi:two-component system OmpR family response regulator